MTDPRLDALKQLAKEAINGWACYAKRQIEHDDIARLSAALAALSVPEKTKDEKS